MNCKKGMKSKLPKNFRFVMKNQYCQKNCHFQNFFVKNLPLIRQTFAMFSVKHLATLALIEFLVSLAVILVG